MLAYLKASTFMNKTEQATSLTLSETPNPALSKKQQKLMVENLALGSPVVEFLSINTYFGETAGDGNSSYLSLASCLQHSFSRGNIVRRASFPRSVASAYLHTLHSTSPPKTLSHPLRSTLPTSSTSSTPSPFGKRPNS